MILIVTEPIWNQFTSDILLLHLVYTLRMKSLELKKSHAVKYYEYIAFNIHLRTKQYYTGIINFVRLKWKNTWLLPMYAIIEVLNKYFDICC